jgi:parvulin-like peptidyl-prolyl isomerase
MESQTITEKFNFNWKRLLITIGIVLITATVISGTVWFLMDQQTKKARVAAESTIKELESRIEILEKQKSAIENSQLKSNKNREPAVKVNEVTIFLDDFNVMLKAYLNNINKLGYEKKSEKEVKKIVLDEMIKNEIIRQETLLRNIDVDEEELAEKYKNFAGSNGGVEKMDKVVKEYYLISREKFIELIIKPTSLKEKLEKKLKNDGELSVESKKKAQNILIEIKKGAEFTELAKKYSEDSTSTNGGDIGWFSRGKMEVNFEIAAFSLNVGEVSDVIETRYGVHLIKVTDKKNDEIRACHILIKLLNFNEWVSEKKNESKIEILIDI